MKLRTLAAMVCAGAQVAGPTVLRAQPAEAPPAEAAADPAKAAYRQGVEYFRQKRYGDAIAEFNKAYRVDPNPVLVFNMARAFEELKDYAAAVEFYRKYLEMAPKAEDRAKVEDSIRTLELLRQRDAAPATVALTVRSEPDGATVFLDGREVGVTPLKLDAPAGKHFLAVEKPGHARVSREVELTAEQPLDELVTLVPGAAPPPVAPAAVEPDGTRTWGWVALAAGGALLAGGGIAGYQALRKSDKLDEIDDDPSLADEDEYDTLKSDGRTFALVADGLFVVGAASVITGAILLLTADPAAESTGAVRPVAGTTSGFSVSF